MKRDFPERAVPPPEADEGALSSLLASRAFWIGSLLSLGVWAPVIYPIYAAAH